ncbi:MAG: DUF1566 domain-containing protein [Prolixibacteraceae bacterium]|nr:DUF1566 domain-containing protein [Prolixibacteraceae bacterium]
MKAKIRIESITSTLVSALILLNMSLAGCSKDDTSETTITGDLTTVPRTAASKGSYPIVGTSQTGIWDGTGNIFTPVLGEAFFGQDAQFAHTTPVYTKSSDGLTVKDEVTGLTWQKSYDSGTYYWAASQNVADNLNTQKYGGFSDWRLPTIKELYSLWNASAGWPWIDTKYFDIKYTDEQDLSHAIFWSSDKYTGVMGNVSGETPGAELTFGVNFGTGHIKSYSISVGPKHQVRCVRGNLAYGVNLFQNNNDGTISDLATSLMWPKADNGSGMDWEHALAYAQTQNKANFLGHNDWRLPNTKELQSLVDYTRSPGATNPANVGPAINAMFSCTAILNDGGKADYPYYWTSTSAISNPTGTYNNAWYVAFGRAENGSGEDLHGAGAVRFDKKIVGTGEGEERVLNYVRLVRNIQ